MVVVYEEWSNRGDPSQNMRKFNTTLEQALINYIECTLGDIPSVDNAKQLLQDRAEECTLMFFEVETEKTWSNWP